MIASVHSPIAPVRRARLVSPLQAALGSFFGGPIGFAYFSRTNCVALGDRAAARKMLALSIAVLLVSLAGIVLALLDPESLAPNLFLGGIPFVLMVAAHRIAERQVASANGSAAFRSSWSVLGIAALCFAASVACALAVIAAVLIVLLVTSGFR